MLQIEHLTCGYGGAPVVRDVSFAVPEGGRLCVLGPNGSGKTTLLRAIAGLLPYTGAITAGGQALNGLPPRRRARAVALMSQFSAAGFDYTVYETVMLGRYAHREGAFWAPDSDADRTAVRESLQRTDTWALRERYVTELSGGQLQRVMLARAFAQAPQVLLLDEPANHLDLRCQAELSASVRAWAAEAPGRCAVAVLHDVNLALELADRVLLLQNGAVRWQGPAAALDTAALDEVYGMDVRGYMQKALARWQA